MSFLGRNFLKSKITFVFVSRAPKLEDKTEDGNRTRQKGFRPLYDIPFMFEAREFLRKKVIGHNVQVDTIYLSLINSEATL